MRTILRLCHLYRGEEAFQNLTCKIYAFIIQCVNYAFFLQIGRGENFDPLLWKLVLPPLLAAAILCRVGDGQPYIYDVGEAEEDEEAAKLPSMHAITIMLTAINMIGVYIFM